MVTRYAIFLLGVAFLISGCVVRTYPVTRDRVDQELSGNRGYLQGQAPAVETDRKATRTTRTVEVEFHPLITFEKGSKQKAPQAQVAQESGDEEAWGNRGYITQSETPEMMGAEGVTYERYTVKKTDTLQKISKEFYGTTKKWNRIFEANRDTLASPNKIYPGQIINVPVESLKEPKENLK